MRSFVDLHTHSTASDGSVPPDQLPALAAKAGLSAIGLTDHDSVEGVQAARNAAAPLGVKVVAGVELTAYAPTPDGPPHPLDDPAFDQDYDGAYYEEEEDDVPF